VLALLATFGLSSCAPQPFIPKDDFPELRTHALELKKFSLRIDKMRKYLETIHKLDAPKPIILKKSGEVYIRVDGQPAEDEEIIAYAVKEHNKIVAKIQHGHMMADIAEALVELHNIKIEMYNAMIDYVRLQNDMAQHYRQLWIEAENRKLIAEYELRMEKWSNKATTAGTILGVAVILLLTL
jgi:replication initiation and membrane attachment protein DnaB